MTTRTWKERGEWMDKHEAYFGNNKHHLCTGGMYGLWYRLGTEWKYGNPRAGGLQASAGVIDEAMDECDRLAREAGEKKSTPLPAKLADMWKHGEITGGKLACEKGRTKK